MPAPISRHGSCTTFRRRRPTNTATARWAAACPGHSERRAVYDDPLDPLYDPDDEHDDPEVPSVIEALFDRPCADDLDLIYHPTERRRV